MTLANSIADTFTVPRNTASQAVGFYGPIPPFCGAKGEPRKLFLVDPGQTLPNGLVGRPNWQSEVDCFTHLTHINTINGSTSHTIRILRPLNWTYFLLAMVANQKIINNAGLKEDPGVYSTNYRYPTPGNAVPAVADAPISSTNNLVMFQLSDGTWRLDLVLSGTFGSSLTLTNGVPNITGVSILKYSPLFYFGAYTLSDPATGAAVGFDTTVSITQDLRGGAEETLWAGLHRGDPLAYYNPNGTAADVFAGAWGVYAKDY